MSYYVKTETLYPFLTRALREHPGNRNRPEEPLHPSVLRQPPGDPEPPGQLVYSGPHERRRGQPRAPRCKGRQRPCAASPESSARGTGS